jgi:hypothetical protein
MHGFTRLAAGVIVGTGLLVAVAPTSALGEAGSPTADSERRVAKALTSQDRSVLREVRPGEALWNSGAFTVGTRSGEDNERSRSIWRFDTSRLADKKILSAELMTVESGSGSCAPSAVQVWRTTRISKNTTWRDQPTWAERLDTRQAAHGFSESCPTAPVSFDVTGAVAFSAKRSMTWTTLGLRAADETDPKAWKRFQADATLAVTYVTPPAAPVDLRFVDPVTSCGAIDGPAAISELTPRLGATPESPDRGGGAQLSVRFEIADLTADPVSAIWTAKSIGVTSGTPVSATVPSSVLIDAGEYVARARTVYRIDGDSSLRSPWTEGCYFTVDTVAPKTPLVTSTDYSECSDTCLAGPPSGEFTFSSQMTDDVVSYVYSLAGQPLVTVAPAVPGGDVTISVTPGSGIRSLSVNAKDAAGNTSGTATFTFRVSG